MIERLVIDKRQFSQADVEDDPTIQDLRLFHMVILGCEVGLTLLSSDIFSLVSSWQPTSIVSTHGSISVRRVTA